jgi:long-subunit fatty acid transport protein
MANSWGGNIYQFTNPLRLEYSYNFDNTTIRRYGMGYIEM